jgi:hypothetical protein
MGMDLQTAIQNAINFPNVTVGVTITMHDENGLVLWGVSAPTFRQGVGGVFFRQVVSEGFSTVGNPRPGPNLQEDQFLASSKRTPNLIQPFDANQPIPLDFTVTRQTFSFLRIGLRSTIQLNLTTLGAAGQVLNRAVLGVAQDGVFLRGVGASLMSPGKQASYTVTLDVVPVIP